MATILLPCVSTDNHDANAYTEALEMLPVLFFIAALSGIRCDSEVQREVVLFYKSDTDGNGHLTRGELDKIFELFDVNNDSKVTDGEFEKDWVSVYNIGGPVEAQALFARADTNDDGIIDMRDLPDIFKFFDSDGDGEVNMNEFLTQWGELKNSPVNPDNVSVDIGK